MSRQVMPCRQSKPNNSNDKKNRKRPCQRARHCYRCEWSCAVLRMALNPRFNNTGNGIYEKTPRCPGGWPVRCRCFCTGTRNGSRPRSCSRRCPRSCSTRSCSEDQGHPHGQEEDRQEGRQEENRPQGSLIWAFRASPVLTTASKSPAFAGVLLGGRSKYCELAAGRWNFCGASGSIA